MLQKKESGEMENKAFSSIDFVGQCMLDTEKASAFERVINDKIKPNHTVLDVGTGSGILALLSARAGAKRVIALEFDPFVAKIAQQNFKNNGYENVIELIVGDARNFAFDKSTIFDVVTMEMLTSGMVDEMQVQAINNLHKRGVVTSKTVFIPCRQDSFVTLSRVNFNHFGFKMKMVLHSWSFFQNIKEEDLSEKKLMNSIDFSRENDESFETTLSIKILKTGMVNTVWLSSCAFVDKNEVLENTKSLNPPVAIPIPDIEVIKGQELKVRVAYKFGYGYKGFSAQIE